MSSEVHEAMLDCLTSEYSPHPDGSPSNIVDAITELHKSTKKIANAITPLDACRGTDDSGGSIGSLTEAVMGLTRAMMQIALAISDVACEVKVINNPRPSQK